MTLIYLFYFYSTLAFATDLMFGGVYEQVPFNIEKDINSARQNFEDKGTHSKRISNALCKKLSSRYRTELFGVDNEKLPTEIELILNCQTYSGVLKVRNQRFIKEFHFSKDQIRTDDKQIGLLIFNNNFTMKGHMAVKHSLTRSIFRLEDGKVYASVIIIPVP